MKFYMSLFFRSDGITWPGRFCGILFPLIGLAMFISVWGALPHAAGVSAWGLVLAVIRAIAGAALFFVGSDIIAGWRGGLQID